jgi:3-phenylpropionate/cinnamic acid dioxygenase small subunit
MNEQEQITLAVKIQLLQARYASSIDNGRLEEWPGYFTEKCIYKVTSEENVALGRPLGMIFADTRGMLKDRVLSLREANIYEQHRYQHLLGMPLVLSRDDTGLLEVETGFLVARVMRDGQTLLFANGRYRDKVEVAADGSLLFREKIVICNSSNVHTLLALPL